MPFFVPPHILPLLQADKRQREQGAPNASGGGGRGYGGGGGGWYFNPDPFGVISGGMNTMNNLGNTIGSQFAFVNALNSQNRQAAYPWEADLYRTDADVFKTQSALAAKLAGLGMLGKLFGNFTNSLGGLGNMFGGIGGGGGMAGYQSTDSPQMASWGQQGGQQGTQNPLEAFQSRPKPRGHMANWRAARGL
jgi:hypothetical protein